MTKGQPEVLGEKPRSISRYLPQLPYILTLCNTNNGADRIEWCGLDSSGTGQGQVTGTCKPDNDTSRFIKHVEFLYYFRVY